MRGSFIATIQRIFSRDARQGVRNYSRCGFTLLELLITVAFIAVVGVVIIQNYASYNVNKKFAATVQKIAFSLDQARNRATVWDKGQAWGVYFQRTGSGCPSKPSFGIYFNIVEDGTTYTSKNYRVLTSILPDGVNFDTSSWDGLASCYRTITFEEITGELMYREGLVATSSMKLFSTHNSAISSTISVSPLGFVSYTTSSLLDF